MTNPARFQESYLRNCAATIFCFIFLIYPTITSYTFSMFTCTTVEGVDYLKPDMSIECWSSTHINILLYFTLPIIIVWVFGYPIFVYILLRLNRNALDEKSTIMKYGLYYIGFKDNSYYWQVIVINVRRMCYIAISVALSKMYYALLCFLVVYVYMQATKMI
jgi:hypothetical protein